MLLYIKAYIILFQCMVIAVLVRTQTRLFQKVGFVAALVPTPLKMLGFILQPNLQIW